ncbi:MAG: SOS response-associated peptidase [Polyangiaceae bacterium]|jgi:putative SOS response-associated peptidase YedK
MCGRTALTASPDDLRDIFGLDETPTLAPHYNVPPSQPLAVVRVMRDRGRKLELLRWGLVPSWADDAKIGHRLSLARIETAATTPAFREAVRRRRCLVVVDGFYEWKRDGENASRPYFLRRPDGAPFALAGLWDRWVSKDGEVIESCAILTQAARPPADAVHERMPVVLEKDAWDAWLDPAQGDVSAILAPRTPDLVTYPVTSYVNDPRHDDERCLEKSEPREPEQGSLF